MKYTALMLCFYVLGLPCFAADTGAETEAATAGYNNVPECSNERVPPSDRAVLGQIANNTLNRMERGQAIASDGSNLNIPNKAVTFLQGSSKYLHPLNPKIKLYSATILTQIGNVDGPVANLHPYILDLVAERATNQKVWLFISNSDKPLCKVIVSKTRLKVRTATPKDKTGAVSAQ